jgi:hypothetical protein
MDDPQNVVQQVCKWYPPLYQVFIWPSLSVTLVRMPQIAKRVMFAGSCNAVSIKLKLGASVGILKSIYIRAVYLSLIDLGHQRLNLHWTDGECSLWIMNRCNFQLEGFFIEIVEANAFRIFIIRIYSLLKSEWLSVIIKLALHKTLIRWVMIYAYPTWEYVVHTYLLKWQSLQKKVLRTILKFPRPIPVLELQMNLQEPCIYVYTKKLWR